MPHLASIAPAVLVPGPVSYEGETYTGQTFGWSAEFMGNMFNIYPAEGSVFDASDIRTKEIGLRKAVGATNKDILHQFLIEAILLTFTGGIIGIAGGLVLSVAATYGISIYLGSPWSFSFPMSAAALGTLVSVLVGLVFGSYPARKASRLSPIEALRYE